jgi:hypothetical protein
VWHIRCQLGTLGTSLALLVSSDPIFRKSAHCDVSLMLAHRLSKIWTKPAVRHALSRYNFCVARGWESKSVEEQQAQAVSTPGPAKLPLTPAQIASQRHKQGLLLSRQRVLQQLEAAQNPRHREILKTALADLDEQLARLV